MDAGNSLVAAAAGSGYPALDMQLSRNTHGQLVLTLPDGVVHAGVLPVRAFPVAAPEEGLSLVGTEGHELLWIEHWSQLNVEQRQLIEEVLLPREFVPEIEAILSVSSFSTPSTWQLRTSRGPAQMVLKAEEDIRRLANRVSLLIAGSDGLIYSIRNTAALDKPSRKLLERFL